MPSSGNAHRLQITLHSAGAKGVRKLEETEGRVGLGGGFKHFLCSPLPGEMIQLD